VLARTLVVMSTPNRTSNVRMTPEARSELSALSVALTSPARRRVSLSDAALAACRLASADVLAAAALLPTPPETGRAER
jgi:hypothetical protein